MLWMIELTDGFTCLWRESGIMTTHELMDTYPQIVSMVCIGVDSG